MTPYTPTDPSSSATIEKVSTSSMLKRGAANSRENHSSRPRGAESWMPGFTAAARPRSAASSPATPGVVRTTRYAAPRGYCRIGQNTCGRVSSSRRSGRVSATTPTISLAWSSTVMRRPSGLLPPKNRRASVSLTMLTGGAPRPSASVKWRPRSSRTPSVAKYSGLTSYQRTVGDSASRPVLPAPSTSSAPTSSPPKSGPADPSATEWTPGIDAACSRARSMVATGS